MESFGILRTHTGLSSNVKVVIDSEYNLFIETIDSVDELSADRFKKIQFNKSSYYDELVPFLFKNVPVDISFSIKYENDNFDMSLDFANQYDDIYLSGARNISNNKDYKEEYEYFAPLYVFKHHLPKYFIIFRVDGPGLIKMTKDNFKTEFLNKFKTVKIFDLTRNSPLGEWIDTNFTSNSSFPVAPLDVDFKKLEFTRWIGIDYDSGGYTSKPFYLEENLENENTLFDFEKFFLDGYKINKVVFPHIINFNYLFDDEPATPQTLRKWSINRYSGFYLNDIEIIDSITPYKMPKLYGDIIIESGNILKSLSFDVPFIDGWRDDIDMWVEYLGNFYKVIKIEEESQRSVVKSKDDRYKRLTIEEIKNPIITKYKIVSDIDLSNKESFLNIRTCYINLQNEIVNLSGSPYTINDFDFADVNLIEINGVFHNIIEENNILKLNTDYGFKFSEDNNFTYFTNSEKEGYSFSWNLLISKTNLPKNWKIYRLRFSDVKDFDTNIIDTEFARHEYEKRDDLTRTEEPKMYLTDLRSKSLPQDFDDFIFKGKTEFVPVASDYTANLETFRVEGNKLTDLWRKNPIYCRWGYQNSTSAYDYPYMLNNNDVEGEWNLTCDTRNIIPDRPSRNLDYFYTLNSGTTSHLYHSLHVEQNYLNVQDTSFRFELDKYLELGTFSQLGTTYSYDFDYFDILFSKTASFLDGELIQNRKKYSYFEAGDRVIPNTTVFRGLKWRLFEVDNIKSNSLNIENINLFSSNFFQDYKLSVLLSSNDLMVYDDNQLYNPYYWDYFIDERNNNTSLSLLGGFSSTPSNVRVGDLIELDQFYPYDNLIYQQSLQPVIGVGSLNLGGYGIILNEGWLGNNDVTEGIWRNKMQWKVIKKWEWDRSYTPGDLVIYEDQIFEIVTGATVSDPNQDPFTLPFEFIENSPNVITYPTYFMLWSNNYIGYLTNEWVYHFGEYYKKTSNTLFNFWNPEYSYSPSDIVNYENRYFECIFPVTSGIRPQVNNRKSGSSSGDIFWREVPESSVTNKAWEKIELWDRNVSTYNAGEYVVYNNTLYQSLIQSTIDDIPGESESVWSRVYSFVPDTDFKYSSLINSIIIMNDSFYYCQYNPGENNSDCKSLCFHRNKSYDTDSKDSIIAEIESNQGFPSTGSEGEDWYFSNKNGEILNQESRNEYDDYNFDELNWSFVKIDNDCSLRFEATEPEIPSDTNIFAFIDTTSMTIGDGTNAKDSLVTWFTDYSNNNTSYIGNLYILPTALNGERWLQSGEVIWKGNLSLSGSTWLPLRVSLSANDARNSATPTQLGGTYLWNAFGFSNQINWIPPKNIIVVNFFDESNTLYHGTSVVNFQSSSIIQPTNSYKRDYWAFTRNSSLSSLYTGTEPTITDGGYYNLFDYFKAVLYPVAKNNNNGKNFVLHGLAAIKGVTISQTEIDSSVEYVGLKTNSSTPITFDYRIDVNTILTQNPYSILVDDLGIPGLEQFGWKGKWDKRSQSGWTTPPGYNAWSTLPDDLNALFLPGRPAEDFYLNVFLPQTSPDACKGDLTLDNGITIYINKKWKNVLVNISINDNTIHSTNPKVLDETKNIERDELYVETNKRLTAANIIQQINDLDTLYGFADFTTYVVIEEDGTFKKYNFNNKINELPYMLIVEEPDEFDLRDDTLRYSLSTVDKNVLKSNRFLVNGNIDNLEKIDFYNELPLGTIIDNVKGEPGISINYNSQKDQISSKLHRHSGYYMPIFYEIELFNNTQLYDSGALCNIQFIAWLGTASVGTTQSITLSFSDSDNSVIKDVVLELPVDDGESEVTEFYDQIINVIESEEIFSEVDFEFEILEPGNENIHPRMSDGYWVLSMSYPRPCDIRISVIDESPCQLILEYFFSQYNYVAEHILSAIDSGPFIVPISTENLCCPDCGPQLLGFLQYTENGLGNETFKNLYDEYIGEDPLVCDVMKHAVATPSNDQFNLWFTGTVNNNAEFTTVISNLSGTPAQQADIFGIGQYGSPNLLTTFLNLVQQSDYPDYLFKELLERGIVINCEDENYIVNRSPVPVIGEIPIEEICVRYILNSSGANVINGYSTFQLNQNGDYEGSFNNIDYVIVYENGTWKVKQDETVVASNSSLTGPYKDESFDSGYSESFVVSEGVCSETSPLFLPKLCMSIVRGTAFGIPLMNDDVLKINLIWTPNENAYIGYEQVEGFLYRKYSIKLVNGRWELYYEDVVSNSGPSFNGPGMLISIMADILPVPISNNWQSADEGSLLHYFEEKARTLINTSSSC